ncbi:hypothetical protein [Streptomyces zhihengii]
MTVHVDVPVLVPAEDEPDSPMQIVRMGIAAEPTATEGLVVFPKITDLFDYDGTVWHVTHTCTGRKLPIDFPTETQAVAYAGSLGGIADWTSPTPAIDVPRLIALAADHDGTVAQRVLDALARKESAA